MPFVQANLHRLKVLAGHHSDNKRTVKIMAITIMRTIAGTTVVWKVSPAAQP